jgi:outer membrane receptor for ferrienterochelin and colicins
MKYISIFTFIFINIFLVTATEPERRSKTDAMLFGDVRSGSEQIPFATVMLKGTTIGTAADASGHFKMSNLPEGSHTVIISAIGYKTWIQEVMLTANSSLTIQAELLPDNIGIEQVVISADRNARNRQQAPSIVNSINPKIF